MFLIGTMKTYSVPAIRKPEILSEEDTRIAIREAVEDERFDRLMYIDVSQLKDFSFLFYGSNMLTLDVISEWDVSNGVDFTRTFGFNERLVDVKAISPWNTKNARTFEDMLVGSRNITSLEPIRNWKNMNEETYRELVIGLRHRNQLNRRRTRDYRRKFENFKKMNDMVKLRLRNPWEFRKTSIK